MATTDSAPSLVLGNPSGPSVMHFVLQVPDGAGAWALGALRSLQPAFGPHVPEANLVSVGFSSAGLAAVGLPESYQRVFRRLAPAFHEGAPRRSRRRGDGGPNAPDRWKIAFRQDRAHLIVSWHGALDWVQDQAERFRRVWRAMPGRIKTEIAEFPGARLGSPGGLPGEWVHFGYRDGLSEIVIDGMSARAPDPRRHATGELLLGHPDDAGSNRFALTRLRDKPRRFFHGGSFGVFRPMSQAVVAFEEQVKEWRRQLAWLQRDGVSREFVKAKLCGRWPDGRVIAPGTYEPSGEGFDLGAALARDREGLGCPFGAHARRMRSPERDDGLSLPRPLQRRSVPYGPAAWEAGPAEDGVERGLLGHFFCADIEVQFEHLLGQWAAHPPLGFPADDRARDPLVGPHEDPAAVLRVPIFERPVQHLGGFQSWTTTLGTLYAWHPDAAAWQAVLDQDYVPIEDEGPWL